MKKSPEDLLKELEKFKNIRSADFKLKKLEDWIIKSLGAKRLQTGKGLGKRKGKGSIRTYYHPALKTFNGDGYFVIHVTHKKQEIVITNNFRKYSYKILKKVIECIALEVYGGKRKS